MRVEKPAPNGRSRDAAAFRAATRAVLEIRVFADAARAVLAELQTLVGADAGLIAVAAADAKGFEVVAGAGSAVPLRRLNARAAKLDPRAFGEELARGTPPRRASGRRSGPRSTLWTPVQIAGEVVGLLGLSDRPAGFAADDRELAAAFAELIAVAMLKSRTMSGFDEVLREATVALTRSIDREAVLTTLLDRLRRMVPFDRASVMLVEEASRVSVRAVFDGDRVVRLSPEERPELAVDDHPIVHGILTTGTAVLISDLRAYSDWSLPIDPSSEVSWLGVPLFARGNVAGLFALSKGEPDFFSREHLRLAEAMSSQASVAVENAILFEQMQASAARMQALSRRLVDVQESERRHIARELHDEAGQTLASLRYGLRLLEREVEAGESVGARIAELMKSTDAVIDGLHRLAADLRPASLDHLGLAAALREYARLAASRLGLDIHFKARGFTGERLPMVVETALYRVTQEAMTNVVRHARATRVDVLAEHRGDRVMVMIEDDGVGFDPDNVARGDHFGLLGLKERAEALGGTLTIESAPGAGTTIVVEVASADPHPDR